MTRKEAEEGGGAAARGEGVVRSSLVVGLATAASRLLGLAREIVIAALFGDSAAADAFFVAFKIPNFLRRLFAEGAFSQAFVPVLAQYRAQKTRAEVRALVDHVAGSLGAALAAVTLLGVLAAPLLAALFAPGYLDSPDRFALLVQLLRLTFPYILLISLTGFAGAILNSHGRFAVPALTPVLLNVSLIGCALILGPLLGEPILALAWGVMLAGLIQLMFQLPFLHHLRMIPRPRLDRRHAGVRRVIGLMVPVMFSVSISQFNLLLDTILATTQASGSVSWLYYSDRLMELPLGVFAIAIATVILPSLARLHARDAAGQFAATLDWALRVVLLAGVPAAVALVVLAQPLIITLFQRGAFEAQSVPPTAAALQAYALGLPAFMAIRVLATGYFSRQDIRTPMRCGIVALACNMAGNLLLILPLAHVGLALATSLAALINAALLLAGLMAGRIYVPGPLWPAWLVRMALASVAMAALLWMLAPAAGQWLDWSAGTRVLNLALVCLAGAGAYGAVLLLLGLRPSHLAR